MSSFQSAAAVNVPMPSLRKPVPNPAPRPATDAPAAPGSESSVNSPAAEGKTAADSPVTTPEKQPRSCGRRAADHGDPAAASDFPSGLDRRRGPGRRRTDYRRAAEEGEMTEEQLTFLMAVDEYKRSNDRRHPTLTEILDVLLFLGYRKVAAQGDFKLTKPRQTPERRKPSTATAPAAAAVTSA